MLLALLPIKFLLQIARRRRTNRIFTINELNVVKKLSTSAALVLKGHDETHSPTRKYPNVHLAKG